MQDAQKAQAQHGIDFLLGCIGLIGLVIILAVRRPKTEISWWAFAAGMATVNFLVLAGSCVAFVAILAAIASTTPPP